MSIYVLSTLDSMVLLPMCLSTSCHAKAITISLTQFVEEPTDLLSP